MGHASSHVRGIRGRWRRRSTTCGRPALELVEAGSVSSTIMGGVAVAGVLLAISPSGHGESSANHRQPAEGPMRRAGDELLINLLNDRERPGSSRRVVPMQLVVRESAGLRPTYRGR